MKIILQYFDKLDSALLVDLKIEEKDIIIDHRIYEHFLRTVYEADFYRYLLEKHNIDVISSNDVITKISARRKAKSKIGSEYHKQRDRIFLFEDKFYSYRYLSGPENPIVIYQWENGEIANFLNETLNNKSFIKKLKDFF